MTVSQLSDVERFMSHVMPEPMSGCWLWIGGRSGNGYGLWGIREKGLKRTEGAHRRSYFLHKGKIPNGMVIDHLCRNRCCVNPDHLEVVTMSENVNRGMMPQINLSKTHCPQGHPYNEENTFIHKRLDGRVGRECFICKRESQKISREKNKESINEQQRTKRQSVTEKQVKCETCNSIFLVGGCRENSGKVGSKFCSKRCRWNFKTRKKLKCVLLY